LRSIGPRQIDYSSIHAHTDALGHILAGQLDVAPRPASTLLAVKFEGRFDFSQYISKRRVLMPPAVVSVLPCMGSQTHKTCERGRTARIHVGQPLLDFLDAESVYQRQNGPADLRIQDLDQFLQHSALIDPPTFTPIGLAMPRKYSTCARVDIGRAHADPGMCVDKLYQRFCRSMYASVPVPREMYPRDWYKNRRGSPHARAGRSRFEKSIRLGNRID